MTTKRFIATDMSRALKKVREELGPDAIILSSKRAEKGVEVVASIEEAPSEEKIARNRFANAFDEEFDQPLASDMEWGDHHEASKIARKTKVAKIPSTPPMQEPAQRAQPARPQVAQVAQAAAEPFASAAANAERLAKEIQAAHERMLASRAQSAAEPVSAFDSDFEDVPQSAPAPIAAGQNRQVAKFAEQARARGLDEQDSDRLHSLYDEIAEMRMLLEEQLWQRNHSPAQQSMPQGRARQLSAQLQQLGLANHLIDELLVCADDNERLPNCWRRALAMLTKRLPVAGHDPIENGGTFAFVGPTGVGKTTTVAKLAARYVLNHGRGKVAIVTTDTYRVGAHDQLKALGRILQVPVRSIEGEHQLEAVLASLRQYPLVLIDTAGFRQGDAKQIQQEKLLAACTGLKRILVLAANSQPQVLRASLHAYGKSPLTGAVLTKLDESASLGEAFGPLCLGNTPIVYTSAGQEIPDDIQLASATDLVAEAVKLARQSEGGDRSSVAQC